MIKLERANTILLTQLKGHLETYGYVMCGRDKQMLEGFTEKVDRYFEKEF